MSIDINNPYFRNQVLTATPEKLRLLLLEGCIRFINQGRKGLQDKDYEQVYEGFSQAKDIVLELITAVDRDRAPELCARISSLYTFVFTRLTEASFEKNLAKADEALSIMEYERETWALFVERLAKERAENNGQPAPDTNPPTNQQPQQPNPASPTNPTNPQAATAAHSNTHTNPVNHAAANPSHNPATRQSISFSA